MTEPDFIENGERVDTHLLEAIGVSRLTGYPGIACLTIQTDEECFHFHLPARGLNWLADELRAQAKRFMD